MLRAPHLLLALCAALVLQAAPARAANPVVHVATELGSFEIELCAELSPLCPSAVPDSVDNFLTYLEDGDYVGSVIHRSLPGFIIQGGGFRVEPDQLVHRVPRDSPILNEPNQSNLRGTVSYAKVGPPEGEEPTEETINSATSEWFVNVGDNPGLDSQNGGFTVFGVVRGEGMQVVDAINALPRLRFFDSQENTAIAIFEPIEIVTAFGEVPVPQELLDRATGMAQPFPTLSEFADGLISTDITLVPEPDVPSAGASALAVLVALAWRRGHRGDQRLRATRAT